MANTTESPTPIARLDPANVRGLSYHDLLNAYHDLYDEYVVMCFAYSRAGDHTHSVETYLTEVLRQADHWHEQYNVLAKKNELIQMPTLEERLSPDVSLRD